jgi:hypothetical protein
VTARIEVIGRGERHWVWRYVDSDDNFALDSNDTYEDRHQAIASARLAYPDVGDLVVIDPRPPAPDSGGRYGRGPQALRLLAIAGAAALGIVVWRRVTR